MRITPHRCTRAEKLLEKHEGVREEMGRWVGWRGDCIERAAFLNQGLRYQCKCWVCPFGLPGKSRLKDPMRVSSTLPEDFGC